MDKAYLHKLIELIVEEVTRRVKALQRQQEHPEDVVVLLPEPLAYPQRLQAHLQKQFGMGYTPVELAGSTGLCMDYLLNAEQLGTAGLYDVLGKAKTVVLASPSIALLSKIAAGDDSDTVSRLVTRAILWKKDVRLLLDFTPPQFLRNTFFEGVASSIETLRSMNVQVETYDTGQATAQVCRELITEQDVLQAAQTEEMTLRCKVGAIITPSARDAIAATGVILKY